MYVTSVGTNTTQQQEILKTEYNQVQHGKTSQMIGFAHCAESARISSVPHKTIAKSDN